jgi:hypothetical protein
VFAGLVDLAMRFGKAETLPNIVALLCDAVPFLAMHFYTVRLNQ